MFANCVLAILDAMFFLPERLNADGSWLDDDLWIPDKLSSNKQHSRWAFPDLQRMKNCKYCNLGCYGLIIPTYTCGLHLFEILQ